MIRRRWLVLAVGFTLVAAGCGGDSEGDGNESPTTAAPAATDAPTTTAAGSDNDSGDDGDQGEGGSLAQNFVTVGSETYAITISTCFASPGVELEVIASLRGVPDSEAYAYVYAAEAGSSDLTLSALRINDGDAIAWRNESGEGATDLVLEDKRISGEAPVTSPDGAEATAVFDFVCPG